MKHRSIYFVFIGATSFALWGCGSPKPESDTAAPVTTANAPQHPAVPAEGTADNPEHLEILSVLSVEHSVDLLAQRDGVIVDVNADQDQWVEKGTVLARMDDRELQAKLEKARQQLEVAQNNLKYQRAEKKAKDAAYRRQQELRKFGLSSAAALEEAEFHSTGAAYDEQSWEAAVRTQHVAIRELELELEKTRIMAPFSGYIVRRSVRAGQNMIKNDPCFRLSQLWPLQVHFLVPESAGPSPKAGDAIKVVPTAGGTREFHAKVLRVSPTIDAASGSYDVTAQLTGGGLNQLRPGMAVKVLWPLRHSKPPV